MVRYKNSRFIGYPPTFGPFLRCCEFMLRRSFGEMMENVWKEFPKQKLALNPVTGQKC
jgi:hypothetical protein